MAPPPLLPLLLPFVLLLAVANAVPPSCSKATCGEHLVQYPFSLNSTTYCGYPGLALVCERNATLILPVKSHRYRVFRINYDTHIIAVTDADVDEHASNTSGCPRLHVNLTIDYASSWLQLAPSDSNITFLYNCKKKITLLSSAVELSGCQQQDGSTWSYALPDGGITGTEAYEYGCEQVVVAPVLDMHKRAIVLAPAAPGNGTFREVLQGGFELNYNAHSQQCDGCERSGGWCGYQRNETAGGMMRFTCFCDGGPTTDRCGTHASTTSHSITFHVFLILLLAFHVWVIKFGSWLSKFCMFLFV